MRLPARILVVGSGGREHALVKACLASPGRPRVIAAPGNGGIALEAPCFPIPAEDVPAIVALAQREQIEFVIVGPEIPLSLGLIDAFIAAGIPAYGPKRDGARLEASKQAIVSVLQGEASKIDFDTAEQKLRVEEAPPCLAPRYDI